LAHGELHGDFEDVGWANAAPAAQDAQAHPYKSAANAHSCPWNDELIDDSEGV